MWIRAQTHNGKEAWIRADKIVSMIKMQNGLGWAATVEGDDPEVSYVVSDNQHTDIIRQQGRQA